MNPFLGKLINWSPCNQCVHLQLLFYCDNWSRLVVCAGSHLHKQGINFIIKTRFQLARIVFFFFTSLNRIHLTGSGKKFCRITFSQIKTGIPILWHILRTNWRAHSFYQCKGVDRFQTQIVWQIRYPWHNIREKWITHWIPYLLTDNIEFGTSIPWPTIQIPGIFAMFGNHHMCQIV